MITAIKFSDNTKVFGNVIEKDKTEGYSCEYCKKQVIHHKSDSGVKIGHFKHKNGESHCPNKVNGETEYHYRTKYDIYQYIKEGWDEKLEIIEVEKWLCNNTIRADVYLETKTKKNKIAIEVQATILTVSEIKARTEKYTENGIFVLWILPYSYNRFYEYILDLENKYDWFLRKKVKLKEMEVFLYWSNNKRLFFWDLEHIYYDGFTCMFFEEHQNEDVEFRRDGEEHYYSGKISKTIKVPSWDISLKFDQFSTRFYNKTEAQNRTYEVPDRKIFTYEHQFFQ